MTQPQRKTISELLAMSSAEVRAYLETLPASEQKAISGELFKAQLRLDLQKSESHNNKTYKQLL